MAFYLRNGGIIGNHTIGPNSSSIYSLTSLRLNPHTNFTGFTFTNAGKTGATGPSLAECESSYAGAYFIGSSDFDVNNGYQSLVIPSDGTYRFTLGGASGGVYTASPPTDASLPVLESYRRATGALVVGEYTLSAGDVITMVIGQGGGDDPSFNNPGGGGGTYVTLGTYSDVTNGIDTLLFAAGGGGAGGGSGTNNVSAGIGQAGTSGGTTASGAGGVNGNGGAVQATIGNSTGGGGYLTNAGNNTTSYFGQTEVPYYSAGFRKGSIGSKQTPSTNGFGGFGGGGSGSGQTSTDNDKGGAGGYSGGGYAFDADIFGGGGGSFAITGSNETITAGGNTSNRHGFFTLEIA